jgi:hypothetical protein
MSGQTFYTWRNEYAGLEADDVGELRDPERENSELNRLLDSDAMTELIQKMIDASSRRLGERSLMSEGLSQRRACGHLSSWPVPAGRRRWRCGASGSLTHGLATGHGLPNGSRFGES